MSGGRVELGLGTGWFEAEHRAYCIPFPSLGERFERLEEQLEIITGLWQTPEGRRFTHAGRHYQLTDSPALPKPVQTPRPPVLFGGCGARRTPRLAARYADEFNLAFRSVDETRAQFERVRHACERTGRDPASLTYSSALVVCCGRDAAEIGQRAASIGREVDEMRANGLAGTPAEVVEKIGRYAEVGAGRVYLRVLDLKDLEHIDLLASEVLPQV